MYTKFGKIWYKGLVFAFLDFWGPTHYVYKIWLSLVHGPRIPLPTHFGGISFCIFRLLGAYSLCIQNLVEFGTWA